MHIGGYFIDNPIALAPMAGITDKPFRRLCREFGAGWAVCEMLTSDPTLRNTRKTLHRSDFVDEGGIVAVQIAGSDPQQMADAARYNVSLGAQLIDINMGCPAKKVCNVQAGSALMQNEPLVAAILNHVRAMHAFYGDTAGVRIARKHIGWYIGEMPDGEQTRREINRLDSAAAQYDMLAGYLERLAGKTDRWACGYRTNAF
ncbi:TPA: tRNA-dihydrouridine synthase [Neisseria meningitidis]